MNIKHSIKKILACATASAMALCLTMPTAFAEDGGTTNNATEAWISKTYNTEVGKAETFSFTATQVTTGDGIENTKANVTIPTISFTANETGTTTKKAKIEFPAFEQEGKYEYTVTESSTLSNPVDESNGHEKMIMSKAEYTMDVYVSNNNNGTYEITKIIVNKTKDDKGNEATGKVDIGNTDSNGFSFNNTYVQEGGTGENPKTPDQTYENDGSFDVSKIVQLNEKNGTAATDQEFTFTASFVFPTGTDEKTLGGIKQTINDATNDVKLGENGTYSFTLKHGQNIKFTEIPVGTKVTVTESATPNYKGSATVVMNGENSDSVSATKYNEDLTISDKIIGQKDNKISVTNTYNNVPTTGIIMNTLPYIMMIALGGIALVGYIYLKNKKYSD